MVVDAIGVSESVAGALLYRMGWNQNRVNDFFGTGDVTVESLFKFDPNAAKQKAPEFCPSCCE